MRKTLIAALILSFAAVNTAHAAKLKKGDKAPKLSIKKWVKGEKYDLSKAKDDEVVVVEFWATWCGPCKTSIPHMSEMQDHFKSKGVTFIGISDEKEKVVEKFLKDGWDAKMRYRVALDDDRETNTAWMKAAGQNGIPCEFVVHKGKIAWIGHPMNGLNLKVAELCGDEDYAKNAKELKELQEKFQEAFQDEEWKDALKASEKLMKLKPTDYTTGMMHYGILATKLKDKDAATKFGHTFVESCDDAQVLNSLAWTMLTEDDFKEARDLKLAMAAAKKSLDLSHEKDPAIMDTYARALFETGDVKAAIKWQKKAIEICDNDQLKKQLEKALEEYEKKSEEGL